MRCSEASAALPTGQGVPEDLGHSPSPSLDSEGRRLYRISRKGMHEPGHRHLQMLTKEGAGEGCDVRSAPPAPPTSASACLERPSCPWAINPAPPTVVRIWDGASRCDFPPIPDQDPRKPSDSREVERPQSERGIVSEFSQKSRRRLSRFLATLDSDAPAFTMALTLPGVWEHLTAEAVVRAFTVLGRRFSAKRSFRSVSVGWKLELQDRGALHYHLLIYGLGEDSALESSVRHWIARQWNELVCLDVTAEQKEHHRWWHIEPRHDRSKGGVVENWERVRDFAGYFSKYLGKAEGVVSSDAEKGYRFWGFWNRSALPEVEPLEVVVPLKVAVSAHRMARKKREKNANAGKHRAIVTALQDKGLTSPFVTGRQLIEGTHEPVTEWQLQKLRQGFVREGRAQVLPGLNGSKESELYLRSITTLAKRNGYRFGKFRFKGACPSTASIVVLGRHAPGMGMDLLRWAYELHGIPVPEFFTRSQARETRRQSAREDPRRHHHQSDFNSLQVAGSVRDASPSRAAKLRHGRLSAAFAGIGE